VSLKSKKSAGFGVNNAEAEGEEKEVSLHTPFIYESEEPQCCLATQALELKRPPSSHLSQPSAYTSHLSDFTPQHDVDIGSC
jgi:hypothetical protein